MRMWIKKEAGGISPVLLVVLAILVVGGVAYLVLNTRTGGLVSGNDAVTDSLNEQIKSLQSQLAAYDSQVKTLQDRLSQANSEGVALQGQLSSANAKIASLTQEISSLRGQITVLDNTVGSLESKTVTMAGLEAQVKNLTQLLAEANKQIVLLESSPDLTKSNVELQDFKISQAAGGLAPIHNMKPHFAGYLEISGTCSHDTGYFVVKDTFAGYPHNLYMYMFGTGETLIIPVLPGGVSVFFGNLSSGGAVEATVTIKYYY